MNRFDLLNDLYFYKTRYHEEKLFVSSFIELIEKNPDCFKRSSISGHITGSAWVLNQSFSQSLLIFHAKLGKWLQPGGHADGDENIPVVAEKELYEETGIKKARLFNNSIFDIDIHQIPEYKKIPAHNHFDIRFLFLADDNENITVNHESLRVQWWSLEDLQDSTSFDNSILRMVRKSLKLKNLLGYK